MHYEDELYLPPLSGMPGLPPQPVYPPAHGHDGARCDRHGHHHRHRFPDATPVPGHLYGAMNPNASLQKTGQRFRVVWGDNNALASSRNAAKGTRRLTLVFYAEPLLYDIQNLAYVEGDIMADEQQDAKHQVQDIVEAGNIDRVRRVLDLAHAVVVESLYPYTKSEVSSLMQYEDIDNIPTDQEQYEITIKVPADFSVTSVNLIAKLINEFFVCTALADWMSIVNPVAQEKWQMKAEQVKAQVRSALTSRMGGRRRRMSPFQ